MTVTVGADMMAANFARVFTAGARVWDAERDCTYTVEVVPSGTLNLSSGVAARWIHPGTSTIFGHPRS